MSAHLHGSAGRKGFTARALYSGVL